MQYIYLNHYKGGYLYVGSHTWDGPEGELDPNYHGSSRYAKKVKATLLKEEFLENVSEDRRYQAEREWIEKYARKYGIHPTVKFLAHKRNNYWVDQFKDGIMLNGHCNDLSQARINGHSKEACRKQAESRAARDDYQDILKAARDKRSAKARKCILQDGFVGCYSEIKEHTGLSQGMVGMSMSKAFRIGSYTTACGWTFQPYYGQAYDDNLRIRCSNCVKLRIGDLEDTVQNIAIKLGLTYKTAHGWANTAKHAGGSFTIKRGRFKGMTIVRIHETNKNTKYDY